MKVMQSIVPVMNRNLCVTTKEVFGSEQHQLSSLVSHSGAQNNAALGTAESLH